jgi:hypothetical protein
VQLRKRYPDGYRQGKRDTRTSEAIDMTSSAKLTEAMRDLLTRAANQPHGRAYNTGRRGFLATYAALVRRGYLVERAPGEVAAITDAGRTAIGRPAVTSLVAEADAVLDRAATTLAEYRATHPGHVALPALASSTSSTSSTEVPAEVVATSIRAIGPGATAAALRTAERVNAGGFDRSLGIDPETVERRTGRAERVEAAPVDWAGRTFGQLTPTERHQVTREAAATLSAELTAMAPAIAADMAEADRFAGTICARCAGEIGPALFADRPATAAPVYVGQVPAVAASCARCGTDRPGDRYRLVEAVEAAPTEHVCPWCKAPHGPGRAERASLTR